MTGRDHGCHSDSPALGVSRASHGLRSELS